MPNPSDAELPQMPKPSDAKSSEPNALRPSDPQNHGCHNILAAHAKDDEFQKENEQCATKNKQNNKKQASKLGCKTTGIKDSIQLVCVASTPH